MTDAPALAFPSHSRCGVQKEDGRACRGVSVGSFVRCLEHLDPIQLDRVLAGLTPGTNFDARDTTFSAELLGKLFNAVRADGDPEGNPTFGVALFDGAHFKRGASLNGLHCTSAAWFRRVRFEGSTEFYGARFDGRAFFNRARFKNISFGEVHFREDTDFSRAHFNGWVNYVGARFEGSASFKRARFMGRSEFATAYFENCADFSNARFELADTLGPMAAGSLVLDGVTFRQPLLIEASAAAVSCRGTEFQGGATIKLRYAMVDLEDAVFTAPSALAPSVRKFAPLSERLGGAVDDDASIAKKSAQLRQARASSFAVNKDADAMWIPMLISLQEVDVSELVVVDINMTDCRFAGAYHLDRLRFDGACTFGYPPRKTPMPWIRPQWTRREILAEERAWRCWSSEKDDQSDEKINEQRLAALYRAIRKALEDSKNEPAAADFYYGEMEMRRFSASLHSFERLLLTSYWIIAGYGQRASRSLLALLVVLMLGTVGFATVGFAASTLIEYRPVIPAASGEPFTYRQIPVPGARPGWTTALDHSVDSATSLLRTTQPVPLTLAGRVSEITLRLLGPLFFGLALLALRARVKR